MTDRRRVYGEAAVLLVAGACVIGSDRTITSHCRTLLGHRRGRYVIPAALGILAFHLLIEELLDEIHRTL